MMAMLASASLRRKKRRARKTARMPAVARQHDGAREIHRQRAGARKRERQGGRRDGHEDLPPGGPERGEPGNQQDACQRHAHSRPSPRAPAQRSEDQEVDRGVFEKVDAVREEGHRSDEQRRRELDAEIRQVQDRDEADNVAQGRLRVIALLRCHDLMLPDNRAWCKYDVSE